MKDYRRRMDAKETEYITVMNTETYTYQLKIMTVADETNAEMMKR